MEYTKYASYGTARQTKVKTAIEVEQINTNEEVYLELER
jgi:hypothetical protein